MDKELRILIFEDNPADAELEMYELSGLEDNEAKLSPV
jgi:hypothetical protein